MLGPFPVAAVVARLAQRVQRLRLVGGAADLATARGAAPKAVPACFVVASESAQPPAGATSGQLIQRVEVALNIVLFVRNAAGQDMGAAARAEMDALVADVRSALVGWSPGQEFDPLSLRAARDEDYALGQLVVQEVYRAYYRLVTVSP
jgi:hypothetical protein